MGRGDVVIAVSVGDGDGVTVSSGGGVSENVTGKPMPRGRDGSAMSDGTGDGVPVGGVPGALSLLDIAIVVSLAIIGGSDSVT